MHNQIKPIHLSFWENGFTPHTLFPLSTEVTESHLGRKAGIPGQRQTLTIGGVELVLPSCSTAAASGGAAETDCHSKSTNQLQSIE